MTDTVAGTASSEARVPIARAVITPKARGAGRFTFGFVGLLALGLKIYEFGASVDWAFAGDLQGILDGQAVAHIDQWVRVAILLLEALATAAVVSIAVTYIVVNNTINNTTNNTSNTSSNTTNVTNYNGQDLGQVIATIGGQITEVRERISQFEQHLVRTEESEAQRMKEFLSIAESERNKRQADALAADKQRFDDIAQSLRQVIEVLNRP